MPVYIRKVPLEIPAPSEQNWIRDDDEDYYLSDPDQAQDRLPQPFRMIEKLIYQVFDQTLEIIKEREEKRDAERARAKHALYEPSTEIQLSGKVNCIAAGGAGRCIFVGLSVGVAVFSLPNYTWICGWETASIDICSITAVYLESQTNVLATVDDMGIARLLCFHKNGLFLIKAINETEDVSKRTICSDVQIAQGGDYAGFLLEGTGESWLEIYRLPKDSWLKELDHFKATAATGSITSTEPATQVTPAPIADNVKLAAPTLIMKIKPPRPVTGSTFKSPMDALQKSDDYSVIGSGQNHAISANQWEQQEAIFLQEFKKYLEVENPEMVQDNKRSSAGFHFLLPCKVLQTGSESKPETGGVPNSISVHWSGNQNLLLYLLARPPKEKADAEPKPDLVWPCAAPIVCSTVSSCSAYMALGFEDGSITIWELKNSGYPLAILALPEESYLHSICFLESPSATDEQPPMDGCPATARAQILARCTNGSLYSITAATGKETNMATLLNSTEDLDCQISAVMPVSILSGAALLVYRSGTVELLDCAEQETVCQFVTPSAYMLASPWQPVFTVDQENACLVFKGDPRQGAGETESRGAAACTLFVFNFESYPFMDSFKTKQESVVSPPQLLTWEKRCQMFLQSRFQSFDERAKQQQDCWRDLQKHAAQVQKLSKERRKARFCPVGI
ncbi:WD repeat-containing protein 93 [Ambystoma mexicanum]|uniref:WD repeat-containing protein 93 n=1 Tax=Ambystoma mexicanum TaxID=8296 RepID=UPI0037E807A4